MRRRKDRIDENQRSIVKTLSRVPGLSVDAGHDDILVGANTLGCAKTFWYEIKSPDQFSKKTKELRPSAKTDQQKKLDSSWIGHRRYVSSAREIIEEIFGPDAAYRLAICEAYD